jgi:hypothetical protein
VAPRLGRRRCSAIAPFRRDQRQTATGVSRLIVVAVYVAIVAALVAVSQVMVSDELTALAFIGFLCASVAFAYAFFRSAPRRCSNCSTLNGGLARVCRRCGTRQAESDRLARAAERLAEEAEREHYASIGSEPVFVFAVDGVDVFPSVGDAADSLGGFDIDDGEFEALITLDGRIVRAESRGEVAVLTVTQQRDVAELKRRLRSFARSAGFLCTPDDPRAVANEILRRQWETRWPKRPRWLDERIHGSNPDQI